jgi:hypothetical protein
LVSVIEWLVVSVSSATKLAVVPAVPNRTVELAGTLVDHVTVALVLPASTRTPDIDGGAGSGVFVAVGGGTVGTTVADGVGLGGGSGVLVAVGTGVGVLVGCGTGVGDGAAILGVGVAVAVGVRVAVAVGDRVGVTVADGVALAVGVVVGGRAEPLKLPLTTGSAMASGSGGLARFAVDSCAAPSSPARTAAGDAPGWVAM